MIKRKLAAILNADAEGYSRLMGEDDTLTVKTITRCRRIFSACVEDRNGRVVNTPGDAVLAEFPSAVDAVACAMEIQAQLATTNDTLPAGQPTLDRKARQIFKQALAIDPDYSRAYAGISLSYFNDWSCQLWDQWETTEKKAYEYAMRAVHLDDMDHVVHYILGRILLFRRQFDQAEQYIDRSLSLNANDADILAQAASSYAWLGRAAEGQKLFRKAMRLNPYRNTWYAPYGALTYFVQQDYTTFIDLALKGPLTEVWIDMPAYIAAACAHCGEKEKAAHYLAIFIKSFQQEIATEPKPSTDAMLNWIRLANPFKFDRDTAHLLQGIQLAGLVGEDLNILE